MIVVASRTHLREGLRRVVSSTQNGNRRQYASDKSQVKVATVAAVLVILKSEMRAAMVSENSLLPNTKKGLPELPYVVVYVLAVFGAPFSWIVSSRVAACLESDSNRLSSNPDEECYSSLFYISVSILTSVLLTSVSASVRVQRPSCYDDAPQSNLILKSNHQWWLSSLTIRNVIISITSARQSPSLCQLCIAIYLVLLFKVAPYNNNIHHCWDALHSIIAAAMYASERNHEGREISIALWGVVGLYVVVGILLFGWGRYKDSKLLRHLKEDSNEKVKSNLRRATISGRRPSARLGQSIIFDDIFDRSQNNSSSGSSRKFEKFRRSGLSRVASESNLPTEMVSESVVSNNNNNNNTTTDGLVYRPYVFADHGYVAESLSDDFLISSEGGLPVLSGLAARHADASNSVGFVADPELTRARLIFQYTPSLVSNDTWQLYLWQMDAPSPAAVRKKLAEVLNEAASVRKRNPLLIPSEKP